MRSSKLQVYELAQNVIFILFFLGCLNFKNLFFYFFFSAALFSVIISTKNVKLDAMVVVLTLFSLCYMFFCPLSSNSVTTILKQLLYPLCYIMGLNFVCSKRGASLQQNERNISLAISICSLGMFGHYVLNMITNFDSQLRNNVDYWAGVTISATGQASLAILAIGLFSAWAFDKSKRKIPAIIGLIIVMAYNLVLAGRTLILITLLVLGAAFLFAITTSKSKRRQKILAISLLFIIVAATAYIENWFDIRYHILGSNLFNRFETMEITEDGRFDNKIKIIQHMFEYPWGGCTLNNMFGYAHGLYLDVYSDAGIFAYILVIIFAFYTFSTAFKIVRNKTHSNNFRILILCVFLALFAEFFVEPIIQGLPRLFCIFCFFGGALKRATSNNTKKLTIQTN